MKKANSPLWKVVAVIALAICVGAGALGTAAAGDDQTGVWKVGTLAPKGVGWAINVEQILMPEISAATDGFVSIKIYWGGIMGDDEHVIQKIENGVLQGAGLSGGGTFLVCPEFSVLSLPFLFASYEEVDYIREKMQPSFDKMMAKNGYAMVAWIDQDFDQVYSISKPLAKAGDFKGATCINWSGVVEEKTLLALSAIPVPTSVPDVARAVKSNAAEGNIGPAIWVVGTQLYSKFRYVNPIKIRYSPVTIAISNEAWNAVGPQNQSRILAIRDDVTRRFVEKSREANDKCMEAMIQYGVQEVQTSPEDLAMMKNLTRPVWNELVGVQYPQPLLNEVVTRLQEFRAPKK